MGTLRLKAEKKITAALTYDADKINNLREEFTQNMKRMRLNNARQNIEAILTDLPGLRKGKGEVAINGIVSVREGIRDSSLSDSEAKEELIKIRTKFLGDLSKFLADETSSGKLKKKSDEPDSPPAAPKDIPLNTEDEIKPLVQESLEEFMAGLEEALQTTAEGELKTYRKNSVQLRSDLMRANFVLGYAPVLPITTTPMSAQKLKNLGFSVATVGDYTVIEDQLVLGIRHKGLEEDLEESMKTKLPEGVTGDKAAAFIKKAAEQLRTKSAAQQKESEEQLVEIIQNTYRNLQLVTFKPSFWAGATWYWLVPNKHLGLFAKATISSGEVPMKLRSWALPFKE